MPRPRDVLDKVKRQRANTVDPLRFYWVDITDERGGGDRGGFAREIRGLSAGDPLLPVVLRIPGFTDSNAVMNDLAAVLAEVKQELLAEGMRECIVRSGYLDVVLISRRELALAVTSSPLFLPDWFPVLAAQEVTAIIDDVTWTTDVPLSATEAHTGDLRRLLCELDRALLKRMEEVGERDRRLAMGLLDKTRVSSEGSLSVTDFAEAARGALGGVRNPRDYRPRRRGPTMVSRLWNASAVTPSDQLPRLARQLAKALQVTQIEIGGHRDSIVTVLGRPTSPIQDPGARWAFDVVWTVGAACQLATAAAHADDYPRYPGRLVGSLSRDLQRALDGFIGVLDP